MCETAAVDRWAVPPVVPAEFWGYPPLAEALAARHMGRVLRAYRCHPWHGRAPVPQEVIGGWLHLAQAQISRVEAGRAGKNLDWLAFVARTLRIPADRLWFRVDGVAVAAELSTVVRGMPNDRIRGARLARRSPSGSGRVWSRQEVAEAVNAAVFAATGRATYLDGNYIGKLERGVIRWPMPHVRAGLRAVFGAASNAELGLFIGHPEQRSVEPVTAPQQQSPVPSAASPGEEAVTRVAVARGELGRLLVGWREASGMSQAGLAERVLWSKATVGGVERGEQQVPRAFWQRCEAVLGAQGALLAASDHVDALAVQCRARNVDVTPAEGSQDGMSGTGGSGTVADAVSDGSGVADESGAVHLTLCSGASVTIAFGETSSGRPVRLVVSAADEPTDTGWSSGEGARVYSMAAWRGRH